MPNVCCSMSCASPKTCLNCRTFVPSTFCAISVRRMGCRAYSQLSAYRTSFRASVSTASLVEGTLISSSSYASPDTGLWSRRARIPVCSGRVSLSLKDSASSTGYWLLELEPGKKSLYSRHGVYVVREAFARVGETATRLVEDGRLKNALQETSPLWGNRAKSTWREFRGVMKSYKHHQLIPSLLRGQQDKTLKPVEI